MKREPFRVEHLKELNRMEGGGLKALKLWSNEEKILKIAQQH
jgi:hypothetical protein